MVVTEKAFPKFPGEIKSYVATPFLSIITNNCAYYTGQNTFKQWYYELALLN